MGTRHRPGRRACRSGRGRTHRRHRDQRARRSDRGYQLSGSVAPTTVAILMLLPLSAFEATAALPGAAVALTRARIAARRLHALTEPDDATRRRPSFPWYRSPGRSGRGGRTQRVRQDHVAHDMADTLRRCSSPRTPTCSPPPCATTCWSPGATPVTMSCGTRYGEADSAAGSTDCPTGCPRSSSVVRRRCRRDSADDCCWPGRWFRGRPPCFSTSRPNTSTRPTPARYWRICSRPGRFSPPDRTVVVATHHLPDDVP